MDNDFTDIQLTNDISKNSHKAEKLLEDTDKMEKFLEHLEKKLSLEVL